MFMRNNAVFKYFKCPNCGRAISFGGRNGTTKCPECGKTIQFQDGEVAGWR